MDIEGFESVGTYYDDANFPRGFSKSGEFTITESDLLHKYGLSLSALESGERSPATAQEKHFIAVCRGDKEPDSQLERTWLKYRSKLGVKPLVSAFGSAHAEVVIDEADFEPDDDIVDDED